MRGLLRPPTAHDAFRPAAAHPGGCRKVMGAVLKAHKGEVDNALTKRIAEQLLGKA